jgi:hypothetical protein
LAEQVRRDMTFGLARARSSLADSLGVLFDDGRELRAHVAAQGLAWDTEVAKLKSIVEDAPVDIMEKALFGATLDDIMTLSEFTDLEIRPVGFVRQNREGNSEPVGPARLRRDDATRTHRDDPTQAHEPVMPTRTVRKSS